MRPPSFVQRVMQWANGKSWWWRGLLLLWFGYLLYQNLAAADIEVVRNNPLGLLDFGMHELGHVLFIPFGEFMTILGGSLFQCLFPLLWLIGCLQRGWYFAATLMICWLGVNLFDVAVYAADAQARLLPLATLSSDYDQAHDWYQILTRLGALDATDMVAAALRTVATLTMVLGLSLGSLLVLHMIRSWYTRDTSQTPE